MSMPMHRLVTFIVIAVGCISTIAANSVFSEPYNALKGVESIQVVFDIRVKTPEALAIHLDLVNDTFEDPEVASLQGKRDFVVIFMGSAVKFITKQTDGYSAQDKKHIDAIAAMVPVLVENGIRLEVCMFAARSQAIEVDSILPGIKPVGNGWISSIGYQRQGYALVSDF